jgi:putative membrane protein
VQILVGILVGVVAVQHLAFLVLEMFLWTSPTGRGVFGLTREFAHETRALAANQGLYNGFLAAGLGWGLVEMNRATDRHDVAVFFLACVVVAGMFGAATVSRRILFVQALPAALALIGVLAL